MQFEDPLYVTCHVCGRSAKYSVSQLLENTAVCTYCHTILEKVSHDMNKLVKEVNDEITWINILLDLESRLGIEIDEKELEGVENIKGLFNLLNSKKPACSNLLDELSHSFKKYGIRLNLANDISVPFSEIFNK